VALAIGALLIVAALVVLATAPKPKRRHTGDNALRTWAGHVGRELGPAFAQLKLPHAPVAEKGKPAPRPHLHTSSPIPDGWRWKISTPGAVTMADLKNLESRLESALNTNRRLVGALEINRDPRAEGWGSLSVWREDPLTVASEVPWKPGARCPKCPEGWVCFGKHRDGSHVHAPLLNDVGAICALLAGRRGSGKSVGLLNIGAHIVSWGVRPILIDTVRQGADLAVLEPLAATEVITTRADAYQAIVEARAECKQRAKIMRARDWKKIPRWAMDEFPPIPVMADEIHDLMADKKCGPEITKFAQETRAMLGFVVGATQYPLAMASPEMSTFRQQLAYRLAYRCSNADEGRVILGATPEGEGPHLLRTGPGSCMADLDGAGVFTMRSWWVPDEWLSRHVRALSEKVTV
jgi:hypothetical protein